MEQKVVPQLPSGSGLPQLRVREEIMAEREVDVDHSTIARWVVHYAPLLNELIRREMRTPNRSWRVDEAYYKGSRPVDLFISRMDSAGNTIEFLLSPKRDLIAGGFLQTRL